jgi:hypothetical protein
VSRLRTFKPIKPLPADRRLAPHRPPDIPRGKFVDIPGQQVMDFTRDEEDTLADPNDVRLA